MEDFLDNKMTREKTIELMNLRTFQYAKKQIKFNATKNSKYNL